MVILAECTDSMFFIAVTGASDKETGCRAHVKIFEVYLLLQVLREFLYEIHFVQYTTSRLPWCVVFI